MRPLSVTESGRPLSGPTLQKEGDGVVRFNPCEIKIDIFCKGMVVDPLSGTGQDACAPKQSAIGFLTFPVLVTSVTDAGYREE